MRWALAFIATSLALLGSAHAADLKLKLKALPPPPPVFQPSVNLFGGFTVAPDSTFGEMGLVAALNRNLNSDGWLFRVRGGLGHYDYNRSVFIRQSVDFQVGDVMIGYQTFMGPTRLSGYIGINGENHDNSDPLAKVKGSEVGLKVQGEIYTEFNPQWYGLALGNYSTAFDSYYVLGKLGYRFMPAVAVGPEVAALGNDRFDAVRAGGFVAFDVTPMAQIILAAGYSWDERSDALNDHSGGYVNVHLRGNF